MLVTPSQAFVIHLIFFDVSQLVLQTKVKQTNKRTNKQTNKRTCVCHDSFCSQPKSGPIKNVDVDKFI